MTQVVGIWSCDGTYGRVTVPFGQTLIELGVPEVNPFDDSFDWVGRAPIVPWREAQLRLTDAPDWIRGADDALIEALIRSLLTAYRAAMSIEEDDFIPASTVLGYAEVSRHGSVIELGKSSWYRVPRDGVTPRGGLDGLYGS